MNRKEALSFIRRQDIDMRVRHQESQKIKRSMKKAYRKSKSPRSEQTIMVRQTSPDPYYYPHIVDIPERMEHTSKFFGGRPSVPQKRSSAGR